MGIFGALATAVSGLRAQSLALEHISDNIANSQTTAFKRAETTFEEIVADSTPGQSRAGVVLAGSRATNTIQGDIQGSDVNTHVAINGDGLFIVEQPTSSSDGTPVFNGNSLYTRRGDFELDRNGFLVNGSGYFLKGLAIDPATGNTAGSLPTVIQVRNDFLPAQTTSEINYRANLATLPLTANYDPTIANSELLNPASFTTDPTTAGTGTVRADESSTFLQQTIAGGAITTLDSVGAPANVQLRWGKVDSVANGGSDTWNLFYLTNSAATGAQTQWQNIGQSYVFGSNGQLSPPVASTTITGLSVDGILIGDVTVQHGQSGLSQFADPGGTARVTQIDQNGFPTGELTSLAISEEGRIVGTYTNGQSVEQAEITLAAFNADGQLQKLDGGAFAATLSSGSPLLNAPGRIIGRSLEGSNSDVADEFTKLIVTQQAYAAGTRIVSTSDEMLQEVLNMVR